METGGGNDHAAARTDHRASRRGRRADPQGGEHDIELLTFIRRARTLGLHLDDIREVLAIRDGGVPPCDTVRELLDTRIAEIDATVTELLALRMALA
ncbi:MerR family DNA-binding protein [Streptomyces sp. NBC_01481]|uniref:MerR family DNA-binding protein n=1 Tax=Streptomyces sp. NBC_01481 TaxID=2975869 RepID=UPI002253A54F|nr:MerR family DNA-binding protein [Streptomyces sp. NBC_01481]MCX4582376.1 MerR family DNA-binding protein [Streptomyces sp. NBC_01481]